jgi:hypothetical protein
MNNIKELGTKELNKLTTLMERLEGEISADWGLSKLSGGFVIISLDEYDNENIFLTCIAGVKNDVEDRADEYPLTVNRTTMTVVDA